MAISTRSKKRASIDKIIEEFCQASAELLARIHARCDRTAEAATGKTGKRGKKTDRRDNNEQ